MKARAVPQSNPYLVRIMVCIFRLICRPYFRLKCEGCGKLPEIARQHPSLIMVLNHSSNLDAAMVGTCAGAEFVGRLRVPSKRELIDDWRTGWFMRALGLFPVDRDALDLSAARTMIRILRSGLGIAMAPEGTRSPTGEVQPFKSGFIKLALQTGTPILPVGVQGTQRALPKGATIPRPRKIVVRFGDVIDLSSYVAQRPDATDEELAEMIRQEVIRLRSGEGKP